MRTSVYCTKSALSRLPATLPLLDGELSSWQLSYDTSELCAKVMETLRVESTDSRDLCPDRRSELKSGDLVPSTNFMVKTLSAFAGFGVLRFPLDGLLRPGLAGLRVSFNGIMLFFN